MTDPLPCSLCKYRIDLQDSYLSSKYCRLGKERIVDYIMAVAGCARFRGTSEPPIRKKVQNIEEDIRVISQNVKAFQAVRCDKKEQSKLRKRQQTTLEKTCVETSPPATRIPHPGHYLDDLGYCWRS